MQETLKKLEQVQEIDIQIDNLLKIKADHPKRLTTFDQDLKTLTAQYDEKNKIVTELEKNYRQQTGALELNEDRVHRSQEKLDKIKTNQEYQALLKEIESLKKNSSVIQENANKVKEELDKHKNQLVTIETSLNDVKSKRQTEVKIIGEEQEKLEVQLQTLQSARKESTVGIQPRYLSLYDKIRTGKFGIGIALAISGNCKACNMRIPPQVYIELQRGAELHFCPSCKRILIFKDLPKNLVQGG